MCGRFENTRLEKEILELFRSANLNVEIDSGISNRSDQDFRSKEDIRPTEKIISVILGNDIYRITRVNWGIKFSDASPLIFNSRIETIKEKRYWASLFSKNRCIVPMTGFYEWNQIGKRKQKYRIFLPDQELFFVPAIYHKDKEDKIFASLITTGPNKFIKTIHHRMPVILDFKNAVDFLNEESVANLERCIPYDDNKPMELEEADK